MIPTSVTNGVANLAAVQNLLGPFLQAQLAARLSFENQISLLTTLIDSSITSSAGLLDSNFTGDAYPSQTVADLLALGQSSSDQYTLANLRGVIGRLLLNVQITFRGVVVPVTSINQIVFPRTGLLDYSQPENIQYFPGLS